MQEHTTPTEEKISYDDFAKVQITAGTILSAEVIEGSEKLLKLSVDFAESAPRQIISGIAKYFPDASTLVGRTAMFVTNLAPRTIFGHESNGMLFALSTDDGAFSLLEPSSTIPKGTRAH
jgi:methionyl-tRNA synthetase